MATNPTPAPATENANGEKEIRTRVKSVIDIDTKSEVSVLKIGKFIPVQTMEEFLARLGNESTVVLRVINEGLEEFAKTQLETSPEIPYVTLDDEDKPVPAPTNLLVFGSEDKEKSFGATILNMAKSLFGYPDIPRGTKLTAAEVIANRDLKTSAKSKAIEFVLSNPAAVETLRKA